MNIIKVGRKWKIEGEGAGWALTKTFPRKWKALVAIDVLANGGRWKEYCIAIKIKKQTWFVPKTYTCIKCGKEKKVKIECRPGYVLKPRPLWDHICPNCYNKENAGGSEVM